MKQELSQADVERAAQRANPTPAEAAALAVQLRERKESLLALRRTLAPEAHHKALDLTRTLAADVEYWPTPDPTVTEGSREQRLDAYRAVRDQLMANIKARFDWRPGGNE